MWTFGSCCFGCVFTVQLLWDISSTLMWVPCLLQVGNPHNIDWVDGWIRWMAALPLKMIPSDCASWILTIMIINMMPYFCMERFNMNVDGTWDWIIMRKHICTWPFYRDHHRPFLWFLSMGSTTACSIGNTLCTGCIIRSVLTVAIKSNTGCWDPFRTCWKLIIEFSEALWVSWSS